MLRLLAYLLSAVLGTASCLVPVCEMSCHPTPELNPGAVANPAADEAQCHEASAPANHETPRPADQHPCKPAHDRSGIGTLWKANTTATELTVTVQTAGPEAARVGDAPVAARRPHANENLESPPRPPHPVSLRI